MEALKEIKTWLLHHPAENVRSLKKGQAAAQQLLFCGQNPAAKLAAAEQLAKETGKELVRVDLSQAVSKYIGETEKNLNAIFDKAAKTGAILYFDEGDALFGKRTEVKDSHDRYANQEVSYLLQKLEAYKGLAILSVSRKESIDAAFLRRFRMVAFTA